VNKTFDEISTGLVLELFPPEAGGSSSARLVAISLTVYRNKCSIPLCLVLRCDFQNNNPKFKQGYIVYSPTLAAFIKWW